MRTLMLTLSAVCAIILCALCAGCAAPAALPTSAPTTPTAPATLTHIPPTWTPRPTPSVTPSATPTEIVFSIVKLISPIKAGHRAQLTIKVAPGSECFLSYTTPSGTVSTTRGLGKRIATPDGICGWTWSIRSNTRPGEGMLEVTVNGVKVTMPIVIEAN